MPDLLLNLKPIQKERVYDLVAQAGVDVSDWSNYGSGDGNPSSNPRFCYDWSFIERGKVVVLSIWYPEIQQIDGVIQVRTNMRQFGLQVAAKFRAQSGRANAKVVWETRAIKFDVALQTAYRERLPIRLIIVDGEMRDIEDEAEASEVSARKLDSSSWVVRQYDWASGEALLIRGGAYGEFVDQFSVSEEVPDTTVERRRTERDEYVRNREVREAALQRANGRCELCGEPGFLTPSHQRYLETHHIIPLAEGGPDVVSNVAALCPKDHRRSHFSVERNEIRETLLALVSAPDRLSK